VEVTTWYILKEITDMKISIQTIRCLMESMECDLDSLESYAKSDEELQIKEEFNKLYNLLDDAQKGSLSFLSLIVI
jgi:hypothetical protein